MPTPPTPLLPERRNLVGAYLLWALGLVFICGLHRFYTRRPVSGTLWLLTFGCCGIGQLVDLFLMPSLVQRANEPLRLLEAQAVAEQAQPPALQRQLLQLARHSGSEGFTLNDAMLALELGRGDDVSTVREQIEALLREHLLDIGNDERGRIIYREP